MVMVKPRPSVTSLQKPSPALAMLVWSLVDYTDDVDDDSEDDYVEGYEADEGGDVYLGQANETNKKIPWAEPVITASLPFTSISLVPSVNLI